MPMKVVRDMEQELVDNVLHIISKIPDLFQLVPDHLIPFLSFFIMQEGLHCVQPTLAEGNIGLYILFEVDFLVEEGKRQTPLPEHLQ